VVADDTLTQTLFLSNSR